MSELSDRATAEGGVWKRGGRGECQRGGRGRGERGERRRGKWGGGAQGTGEGRERGELEMGRGLTIVTQEVLDHPSSFLQRDTSLFSVQT